jgi:hypothetical protein
MREGQRQAGREDARLAHPSGDGRRICRLEAGDRPDGLDPARRAEHGDRPREATRVLT